MFASTSGARQRKGTLKRARLEALAEAKPLAGIVVGGKVGSGTGGADFSLVDLGDSARLLLMFSAKPRGMFAEQAEDALRAVEAALGKQSHRMAIVSQTVFLRHKSDQPECERIFSACYGANGPVTNYVIQPPCGGAALALEAWAIGGEGVRHQRFGPHAVAMTYDGLRWVHCAGICAGVKTIGVYAQMMEVMSRMQEALTQAGSRFEQVVRTWYYLGGITGLEGGTQRYQELNRARADFYGGLRFGCSLPVPSIPQGIYPASTGIGMAGTGLVAGCVSLETQRKDAFLLPLENPLQTPAYAYHPKYSPQSPKFSRAKALVLGNYVTTWISGTASVVHSESRHAGDVEKQTEQTIDNIERLIARENFAFHGVRAAGAGLGDMAKVRVYLKRPQDFVKCKIICERRFGHVPAIYALADICRPELLVEIEGVAFSRYQGEEARAASKANHPAES
jgi:enamine deaminase RidA (YjgF/YER057c/UK114 family)